MAPDSEFRTQNLADGLLQGSTFLVLQQIIQVLVGAMTAILTMRYFGPEKFGVLAVGMGLVGIIGLGTWNIEASLERMLPEFDQQGEAGKLWQAITITMVLNILLGGLLVMGVHLSADFIADQYEEVPQLGELLTIMSWGIIFGTLRGVVDRILRGLQQFQGVVWLTSLQEVGNLLIIMLTIWGGWTIFTYAWLGVGLSVLISLGGFLVVSLWVIPSWKDGKHQFSWTEFQGIAQRMFRFSNPLMGARLLYEVYKNMGEVILGYFLGAGATGLFSLARRILERGVSLISRIHSSLLPVLAGEYDRGEHEMIEKALEYAFRFILVMGVVGTTFIFVFAQELVLLFGGHEFAAATPILRIFSLQLLFRLGTQPLSTVFHLQEKTKILFGISAARLGIDIVAYLILIPLLAVEGAALSHILGYACVLYPVIRLATFHQEGLQKEFLIKGLKRAFFSTGVLLFIAFVPLSMQWPLWSIAGVLLLKTILLLGGAFATIFGTGLLKKRDLQLIQHASLAHASMNRVKNWLLGHLIEKVDYISRWSTTPHTKR